jgi:1,4-alpha-glucan branching enzyme
MIAEESTAFAGVSHPTYDGGLGFGMKWMMGWMHDTLDYFAKPTIYRKFHHGSMSFSIVYAFAENFVLPFSHDEVVHGKASLLHKMPGDDWQKFANLRFLYGYMFTHPGAKLLFMGAEMAQRSEWNFTAQLEWNLLEYAPHKGIQKLIRELNNLYKKQPALHQKNFEDEGFEWIDFMDHEQSILAFLRKGKHKKDDLVVLCNFTEIPRKEYQVGVPEAYAWKEIFNTDAKQFDGSNVLNKSQIKPKKEEKHGKKYSIRLTIPPLGMTVLKQVVKTGK